jgi:hypothetical protein
MSIILRGAQRHDASWMMREAEASCIMTDITKGPFSEITSTPLTLPFVPSCGFGLHAEAAWTKGLSAGGFM